MGKRLDLAGKKFGMVQVLHYTRSINNAAYWKCRCDCGREYEYLGHYFNDKTRIPKNCGCLRGLSVSKAKANKDPLAVARNNAFWVFRRNAKKRNLKVSITYEQWYELSQGSCFYCGTFRSNTNKVGGDPKFCGRLPFLYNGIDRLDNSIGYTPENSVSCCKNCNFAKHAMSVDDFLSMVKNIYEYRRLG